MEGTILRSCLLTMLLTCACAAGGGESPGAAPGDILRCRVTAADPDAAKAFFDPGEYVFDAPRVSVMSGVKGGLYITAEKPLEGGDRLIVTLHLLNGQGFEVIRKNNSFQWRAPRPPCTLTEKDFQGKNVPLRGLRPFPYIGIQRLIRRDIATFGGKSVWFERFTIRFREFRIDGGKLSLRAAFEGSVAEKNIKMHGAGFRIEGEIDVSGRVPGAMMVD
jgi:hypothetical protein